MALLLSANGRTLALLFFHDGFLRPDFPDGSLCLHLAKRRRYRGLPLGQPPLAPLAGRIHHERYLDRRRLHQWHRRIYFQQRAGMGAGALGLCAQPDHRRPGFCPPYAARPLPDDARPFSPALWQAYCRPAFFAGPGGGNFLDGGHPHRPGHHFWRHSWPGYAHGHHPFRLDHHCLYRTGGLVVGCPHRFCTAHPLAGRAMPHPAFCLSAYRRLASHLAVLSNPAWRSSYPLAQPRRAGRVLLELVGLRHLPDFWRHPLAGLLSKGAGVEG